MTDREKVIKGFMCCDGAAVHLGHCQEYCPYLGKSERADKCVEKLHSDALALLKEQEPVKPIDETCWNYTYGRCGHCRAPLPALEGLHSKFCWMCGKPVKWE